MNGFGAHDSAVQVVDFWTANAELFVIEEVHDYFPPPFGRGWRCDRSAWRTYTKPTIGSAPGGDWFHVEIAPTYADDPGYYEAAFASLIGPASDALRVDAGPPASMVPSGSPELSVAFSDVVRADVKALQEILIARGWADFTEADGRYGNRTMEAVKVMQAALGFSGGSLDGKCGPRTSSKLAEWLATAP